MTKFSALLDTYITAKQGVDSGVNSMAMSREGYLKAMDKARTELDDFVETHMLNKSENTT